MQLTTSNSLTITVTGAAGGAGGGENASGSTGGSGSGTVGGTGGPGGGTDGGTGGNGGGGAFGGAGTAGSGGDPGLGGGGGGGAGLVINGASLVVTTGGLVTGGAGGAGGGANSSFSGNLGDGGTGGAGIASASISLQVSNSGTITGGVGGDAGFLGFLGNGATNGVGGAGGAGVSLSGDLTSFTNTGTVRGGAGGLLNTLNSYTGSGAGGDGGAGLVISGAGGIVGNSGTIRGATGGYDIDSNVSQGGASGAGVILSGSGTSLATGTVLTNNAGGTIVGANRDVLFAVSGPDNGGAGVSISGNYNSLNNAGTITGGSAGTAGTAGVRVTGSNNLIVSSGTITGGGSGGTVAPSVQFDGNNNTLELRAGYALSGGAKVNGTGGTLVLGGTTNAAFDLSRLGTSATSFNGFSAFSKTGTSTWTLNNIYTGTSNWSIQQGTMAMASLAEVTGTASVASGAALSVLALSRIHGQVTIANGGTLVTTTTTSAAALDGLTLSPNSILEMNVTRAGNTTGLLTLGSGGGLVLDGTLNIVNSSNALAAGTYRLFNVIGTMTDNTMVIGSAPIQYSYTINTSDPVFITLLVEANISYWNGAQTTQNGIVNGGTGTWDASTTNWTNATGTIAKVWGGYEAYFQGTPGTVTVDNAGVSAYLMHFGVDGYALSGGSLTLLSLSAAKPIIEVTTGSATIQSAIAGTAGLDKTGAGTLVLGGANTYTGNTNITAGTLQIDGGGSILGNVANSGALVFNPSSDMTFAGAISGTGSLTKSGAGKVTLSGANTYTGGTTISGGTLQVDGTGTLGSGNILDNGALVVNTTSALSVSDVISGTGSLTQSGAGGLTLSGANTYTGATTVSAGTLTVSNATGLGAVSGGTTVASGAALALTGGITVGAEALTLSGTGVSGAGALSSVNSGANIFQGAITLAAASSINAQNTSALNLSGGITGANTDLTLGGSSNNGGTISGVIAIGSGSITKSGTQWTLAGANTYTGLTTVNSGSLFVTNSLGLGSTASGTVVASGASLALGSGVNIVGEALTLSGTGVGGFGALLASGGSSTYSGDITLAADSQINAGLSAIASTLTVSGDITGSGRNLTLAGPGTGTASGVIATGTGGLTKVNAGTWSLTGANSYTGGTTVSAGTLSIGNGGATGSIAGDVSVVSGANLAFNRSDDTTFGGVISGAGSLTKLGDGELTLTGTNRHTGGTTISAGTLVIGDGAASGAITGDIVNNATLAFDRSDAMTFAGGISSTGAIDKRNTNTLTLTGNASAFTGTANVLAGTLSLSTSAYGGSINVRNGATLTGAGNASGTVSVQNGGTIAVPTGGTTSYGTLALNQISHLALTLPAGVNGAPFYSVGNLTLDGVLDIASSGSYAYGTYRLIDYTGSLTNNTLDIGTGTPWQYTFSVVVDAASQEVSLLVEGNTGYWNGTSAPPSGTIRGGYGTWTSDPSTFNWTDRTGTIAENWLSYKSAFAGTAGTVTIDNTYAQVQTAGMQFTVDGYSLTGGDLLLSNTINPQGQIPIEVGDGTPAGAAMSATIATVLTGTQGMTKTGLGTLILSADNTYTDHTTIAAGTLQIGNGATTGGIAGDVVNNGKLVFNRSDAVTFAGDISGTGEVEKRGGGTLSLSGTNTFSGGTTVSAGTLALVSGSAIGDLSAVTVMAGASLVSGAAETIGSLAGAGGVTLNSSNLTVGGDNSSTVFSGVVSGNGGLIKTGTGTMTLSGANTATGGTTVSAGRLIVSSGSALSDTANVFVDTGATLELVNANESVGAIANGGAIVLNANTLTVGGGNNGGTFSGTISGSGGLTKIGAGQQTLAGTNTFSGRVQISAGTLVVQNGAALNDQSAVTVDSGAILGLLGSETIGSLAGAGNVTTVAATTLTTGGNNASTQFSGVINELAGGMSLVKTGTGTITLTGANTYVGGTTISGGTLQLGNGGATGSILGNVTNNGTLAFNRSNVVTFASVVSGTGSLTQAGAGTLILTGTNTYTGGTTITAGTLQVGNGGTTGWIGGNVANSGTLAFNRSDDIVAPGTITGSGALEQRGTGKLTLSGFNSAGDGTTVTAGTLEILGGATLASDVVVQSGATLKGETNGITATIDGAVSVLNGGTLLATPGTAAGTSGMAMSRLTLANNANLSVVLGSNNGNTVLSAGTLALDGVLNVTDAGAMALGVYRIIDYTTLASDNGLRIGTTPGGFAYEIQQQSGKVNLAVLDDDILYWNGARTTSDGTVHGGSGTWTNASGATNWTTAPANQSQAWNDSFALFSGTAGTVTIDATLGAVSATGVQFMIDGYAVGGDTLTLASTSGQTQIRVGDGTASGAGYTANVGAVLAGITGLEKTDFGTLVLTGNNSYTGGTTITQGTLQLGNGGTSGSILGDVTNDGTLAFDRADNSSFVGAISGTGALVKSGSGTLALLGTNSFGGSTTVSEGRLLIGGGSSLSDTAAVQIAAGAALELQDANETVAGLSGAGAIELNSHCLTVGGGASSTYSGSMSGAGCLAKSGTGTLTLSGTNSFSGGTTVAEGTLRVVGTGALGSGDLALHGRGTLHVGDSFAYGGAISLTKASGIGGGTFAVDAGETLTLSGTVAGTGALEKTGTGTLSLTGINTYDGGTTVSEGTLEVATAGALGTGALALEGAATLHASDSFTFGSAVSLTRIGGTGGGTFEVDGGRSLTIAGVLGGTGALEKTGDGTLALDGANTFGGGTTISEGILQVTDAGALGTGALALEAAGILRASGTFAYGQAISLTKVGGIGGGTFEIDGTRTLTLKGDITGSGSLDKTGAGTLAISGRNTSEGAMNVAAGTLIANGGRAIGDMSALSIANGAEFRLRGDETVGSVAGSGTLVLDGASLTAGGNNASTSYEGSISGSGGLTKTGSGTLTLAGVNTYGGDTTVADGRLRVTGSLGGDAYVRNGATLSGGGTIAGTVYVLEGGTVSGAQAGGLAMGGLDLSSTAGMVVTLGAPGSDPVFDVAGNVKLDGSLDVNAETGFGLGVYRIINYTGTLTDNGMDVSGLSAGFTGGVQSSVANQVNLVVSDAHSSISFWNGKNTGPTGAVLGGSGVWTASAQTNWTDSGGTMPRSWNSGFAIFQGAAGTVTVDNTVAQVSTTGMQFAESGYVVQGGAIRLAGGDAGAAIRVGDGTSAGAATVATIASSLIGTTGVNKTDYGTLVLTGTNTYSGGTTVSAGTLQIGNGGTSGAIRGDVSNNAALVFNRSNDITFGGAISGRGDVAKRGAGTLTLTGNNTYSGDTIVSAGTLQIGNGGTSGSIGGDVANNGALVFDRSDNIAFGGDISGTGELTKRGAGILSLTGRNSYSGGTSVTAGTLQVSGTSALGTGGLAMRGAAILEASVTFTSANAVSLTAVGRSGGGTFDVDAARTLTLSGKVSGSGGLVKSGDGLLILTGHNDYAGLTTVAEGTLQIGNGGTTGSIAGDIVNNASLVFNRSDTYAFSDAVSGSGNVTFTGGGTVIYSSSYAGPISVLDANLQLQAGAVTTSPFTISDGGVFGGSATIGGLTVNRGGTVAPGYSPGTITVNGPVTFNAGSVYAVDATPAGDHDLIAATGPVTLSSEASVQVQATAGRYDTARTHAILTTTDALTGTFGSVSSNYAFLTPNLTYDARNVYLRLAYNDVDFAEFARTGNQASVAAALQALGSGNVLYDTILGLSEAAVAPAFDQLTGEVHASTQTVVQQQSSHLRDAVGSRLRQSRIGSAEDALSSAAQAAGPATAQIGHDLTPTWWTEGYGGWGNGSATANAAGISDRIGGVFGGVDVGVFDNYRMGIVGGFSQSSYDVDARSSWGSIDNYDIGLYGSGQFGALALRGGASYTWHDVSSGRSVNFPGFSGHNNADYSLGTTQLFGEVAYDFSVGDAAFEPFAGLAYVNVSGSSFTESGSRASALSVDTASQDTFYSTLGVRAATSIAVADGTFVPSLTLGWQHAFGDTTPSAQMLFSGGATPFEVQGLPIAKDVALLGVGIAFQPTDLAEFNFNYTGEIAADANQNTFSAQFSLKF